MKLIPPFNPIRVGIDIDGVLADFIPSYVRRLKHIHLAQTKKPHSAPFDISQWDEWHCESKLGFSKDTVSECWSGLVEDGNFWYQLPRLHDTDMLQQFAHTHDVYFITQRPLTTKSVTERWLYEVCGIKNSTLLVTQRDKGPLVHGLDLHAMIDDRPDNLVNTLKHSKTGCVPVLIDQPWNQGEDFAYIKRVNNLDQALSLVSAEVAKHGR